MKHIGFIVVIMILSVVGSSAYAGSYRVMAQQDGHPDHAVYTNICDELLQLCHVFMGVKKAGTGQDIELDIGIMRRAEGFYLQFKSGQEYFLISEKDKVLFAPFENQTSIQLSADVFVQGNVAKDDPTEDFDLLVVRPSLEKLATLNLIITVDRE